MKAIPQWLQIPCICVLLLPLLFAGGCGGKGKSATTPPGRQADGNAPATTKKPASKATQRSYIINGITYYPIPSARGYVEQGIASWYGEPFHGRKTSNGETYDMYGDTAAHKTLPMDTMLLVKNVENGRSTVVRVNDRGPFVRERIIDLTMTKAKELDIYGKGTAQVEIVALAEGEPAETPPLIAAQKTPKKPEEKPAVKPQHKPPPVQDFDKGNFYVQVGAFVKIDNARLMAKAFAKRGRDVIIQQYPAAGMNLYRVMIFASNSLAKAKIYEKELEAEGFRYALLLAR